MGIRLARGVVVGGALLLAACAGGGGEPPRRPVATVTDSVDVVDPALLVGGTWECRELNPYPDLPEQTIATSYAADGTFVSESRSAPRPPLGAMLVKARGRWSAQGGEIVTSDVTTEAGSADGDAWTNMMAKAASSLVNSFGDAQMRGAGEVLRLDRRDLLLRPVGVEDPPVISCSRGG